MSNPIMIYCLFNFSFLIAFIFFLCFCLNAQTEKTSIHQLISAIEEQEILLAKCQQKERRISHFCYDFCPTRLVKPLYPNGARQAGISGMVKVEVIVNESGKVIYARAIKGKPFLSQSALQAAYRSTFKPRKNCDNQPIKFWGTINYNFISLKNALI